MVTNAQTTSLASAPPLMGWWSWTAYYFGLNEGAALTNAAWEAQYGQFAFKGTWTDRFYHAPDLIPTMPEGEPSTKP